MSDVKFVQLKGLGLGSKSKARPAFTPTFFDQSIPIPSASRSKRAKRRARGKSRMRTNPQTYLGLFMGIFRRIGERMVEEKYLDEMIHTTTEEYLDSIKQDLRL